MRPGGILALALLAAAVVARRRLDLVEVRGGSMAPTLLPGDRLLVVRLGRPPRAGEIVLAADPRDERRELVKRVVHVGHGGVELRGDNPAMSTDGRAFGAVPAGAVAWRVALRTWPPDRIGRLPDALVPVDEGGEPACAFPEALIAG